MNLQEFQNIEEKVIATGSCIITRRATEEFSNSHYSSRMKFNLILAILFAIVSVTMYISNYVFDTGFTSSAYILMFGSILLFSYWFRMRKLIKVTIDNNMKYYKNLEQKVNYHIGFLVLESEHDNGYGFLKIWYSDIAKIFEGNRYGVLLHKDMTRLIFIDKENLQNTDFKDLFGKIQLLSPNLKYVKMSK